MRLLPRSTSDPGARRRVSAAVFAAACVLTALMAAPVLLAPSSRIIGTEMVGRHADAYTMVQHFDSVPRLGYWTQPVTDWPATLVARWVGGVAAFNLIVLASFPLTVLTSFWLARYLGVSLAGSVLVGVLFSFGPHHVAHAAYHPHIVQLQWIPLYLLALAACVNRWSPARAVGLVAAAALAGFSNFYLGLILGVLTPVALFAFALTPRETPSTVTGRERVASLLATVATLGGAAILGVAYIVRVAPEVLDGSDRYAFPFEDLARYGARWWSYLLPPVEHPVWGAKVAGVWEQHGIGDGLVEQQLSVGFSLLILAAVAAVGWLRGRRDQGLAWLPALAIVALAAAWCSLGPFQTLGAFTFRRPSAVLFEWLPIFRAYARFGHVVWLVAALAAGIGFSILWSRKTPGRALAVGLVLVACLELAPVPWRWHWVLPTEAHRWLAELEEPDLSILDCVVASSGEATLRYLMPKPLDQPRTVVGDCAEPDLAAKLAALGYTHVLMRSDYYLADVLPASGLRLDRDFADSRVYRVTAEPAAVYVGRTARFSWRESDGSRTWRWQGTRGSWQIVNTTAAELAVELEVELSSYAHPRQVSLLLNGEQVAEHRVTTSPAAYVVPLRLPPGESRLVFRPEGEAVSPAEVAGALDTRELSLAVGEWRWKPAVGLAELSTSTP
jgi:hypothetical protein